VDEVINRIDPWETPCFTAPQSEKKFWAVLGDFTSTFCLLLDKLDLNQTLYTPQIQYKCNLAKISWFTQSKAFANHRKFLQRTFFG
jgi:hypothetical protein